MIIIVEFLVTVLSITYFKNYSLMVDCPFKFKNKLLKSDFVSTLLVCGDFHWQVQIQQWRLYTCTDQMIVPTVNLLYYQGMG